MRKTILLVNLMLFFLLNAYSQSADSIITINKNKYSLNGRVIPLKEVKKILKSDVATATEMKQYKKYSLTASALGGVGAGVFLISELMYFGKKEPAFLAIGIAGFSVGILGSLLARIPAKKHLKNAVDIYNSKYKSSELNPVQLDVMVNYNSLGVRINF